MSVYPLLIYGWVFEWPEMILLAEYFEVAENEIFPKFLQLQTIIYKEWGLNLGHAQHDFQPDKFFLSYNVPYQWSLKQIKEVMEIVPDARVIKMIERIFPEKYFSRNIDLHNILHCE